MLENYAKDKKNEIIYPSMLSGSCFVIVICLIYMLCMFIAPVSGEDISFNATISVATGGGYNKLMNLTVKDARNISDLSIVRQYGLYLWKDSALPPLSAYTDYNTPFTAYVKDTANNDLKVGEGSLILIFIKNDSLRTATYDTRLEFTSWNYSYFLNKNQIGHKRVNLSYSMASIDNLGPSYQDTTTPFTNANAYNASAYFSHPTTDYVAGNPMTSVTAPNRLIYNKIYFNTTGGYATPIRVNVDIKDKNTNQYITGVVWGSADNAIGDYYYTTSSTGATYLEYTGINYNVPLYLGEELVITGYKPNEYEANHTYHTIITKYTDIVTLYLSPISNTTLYNTTTEIKVIDAYNMQPIKNASLSINSYQLGWVNSSSQTGVFSISTALGDYLSLYASATGYNNNYILNSLVDGNGKTISLVKPNASTVGTNVTTATFQVIDEYNDNPVVGVQVFCNLPDNSRIDGITRSGGLESFIIDRGTTSPYLVDCAALESANYYGMVVTSINLTGQTTVYTTMRLARKAYVATPTYTASPTITVTAQPTNIGGSVKNGTPAYCGVNDGTIVGYYKQYVACWGVSDRYSQDLVLACIIIIIFMFFGARYGKGLGAIIGASAGFIISTAANLIDLWLFFALVIFAALIFALKLFNAGKD